MLFKKKPVRNLSLSIYAILFCSAIIGTAAIADDLEVGLVRFEADSTLVFIGQGVWGLVFDTSECENCRETLPEWRFIDNLKVDSIMYIDSTVPYTESRQMEDWGIYSAELIQSLDSLNTHRLLRMYLSAVRHDTLYWDSIRGKWHIRKDFTLCHKIYFDQGINVDSAINILDNVPGIVNPGGFPNYMPQSL